MTNDKGRRLESLDMSTQSPKPLFKVTRVQPSKNKLKAIPADIGSKKSGRKSKLPTEIEEKAPPIALARSLFR